MVLFEVAAARAFDKGQLSSEAKYPDAAIEAARDGLAARFARICGVAFQPTTATVTLAGTRDGVLLLPHPLVTAITAAATWDGAAWVALTDAERAALALDGYRLAWPGAAWRWRGRAVRLTYQHGYDPTPHDVQRAALIATVNELVPTNISDRTMSFSDQNGQTFRYATPGVGKSYFGLPLVDSVLNEYRELWWTPRVG